MQSAETELAQSMISALPTVRLLITTAVVLQNPAVNDFSKWFLMFADI